MEIMVQMNMVKIQKLVKNYFVKTKASVSVERNRGFFNLISDNYLIAITLISTFTFRGNLETCTVSLAG